MPSPRASGVAFFGADFIYRTGFMRSNTSATSARRLRRTAERRARRRPAIIATGLAFALVAAAGVTLTAPMSQASASGAGADFALASFSASATIAPVASTTGTDDIAVAARDALSQASTAMDAAATVTADIQASGLDIGTTDTSVDTTKLQTAVTRLEGATRLPAPLVPDFTDDVTDLVASVQGRVTGLRSSLDAAVALKAQQDAAAQAQRDAEAAAAAAEAAAAKPAAASVSSSPTYAASGTSAGEAQATARGMLAGYGWGDDQFGCLVSLWDRESGWNYQSYNSSSGAAGIPQALPGSKMASAGADWQTNPATQIAWGLGYIAGRYGNPCGAWAHSESNGWY